MESEPGPDGRDTGESASVTGSRGGLPRWVKRLLILVVIIVATWMLLVVPICQVYRGR
jgi:phage-related holin